MPTSKRKIAEQVLFQLKGGDPSAGASVEMPEVLEKIGQIANARIKATFFSDTMAAGERVPDGAVIGVYENIEVESYKTEYARITLPAMPISLPMGLGLWSIKGSDDPLGMAAFIPVPPGQFAMYQKESLLADVLGQIGYELKGKTVVFTKDITATAPAVTSVDVEMIVLDMSKYDDYELLPLTADQENDIVNDAYKFFAAQMPPDKIVDPSTEPTKQQ
jgi:hypothetical protein